MPLESLQPQAKDEKHTCGKCDHTFHTEEDFKMHSRYHRVLPTTLLSCDYPECHRIDYHGFTSREYLWLHQCQIHGALSTLQTIYLEYSHLTINSTDEDAVQEVIMDWYEGYEDSEA
jgi:hypothetical protein